MDVAQHVMVKEHPGILKLADGAGIVMALATFMK